jgi:hypothetical protein
MPKTTKDTTPIKMDFEIAQDRACDLADYTVNFVTVRQAHDLAPMLAGLPGGRCQCPHWGVMLAGRMTATYGDHEEVYEKGDVWYMPPGHTAAAEAGSEFIQFSPADQLAATEAAIASFMASRR